MATGAALQVSSLNVSYGKSRALFDANLTFPANAVSVIVGRNGAGKTTLLKAIAGFLRPSSGSVVFQGDEICGLRPYQVVRKGVKYIPQDKEVFSDLTVKENLELASYAMKDHDWTRVLRYFPKLRELMHRKGAYLSGGERQMLMIGRAILGKTDVLLVDEPTEGLAPTIVQDLTATFKQLAGDCTLVLVEQNLAVARELADQLYLMKEGKVVAHLTDRADIESLAFEKDL
ncbi:MAG TPA: ABC transporter ATP-binding protein [Bacillota bacterium]|nr:ABC transporter ATP-binding protein [Bacillota bacterium]